MFSNAKSSWDIEMWSELVLFDNEDFSPPLEHAMYDQMPPPWILPPKIWDKKLPPPNISKISPP